MAEQDLPGSDLSGQVQNNGAANNYPQGNPNPVNFNQVLSESATSQPPADMNMAPPADVNLSTPPAGMPVNPPTPVSQPITPPPAQPVNPVADLNQSDFFPNAPAVPETNPQVVTTPAEVVQESVQTDPAPAASPMKKIAIITSILIGAIVLIIALLIAGTEYGILKFGLEKFYLKTGIQTLWKGLPYDAKSSLALSAQNMGSLSGYHYAGDLRLTFKPTTSLPTEEETSKNLSTTTDLAKADSNPQFVLAGQTSATQSTATAKSTSNISEADLKVTFKGDKSGDDHKLTLNITNSLNSSQTVLQAVISNDAIYFQSEDQTPTKETSKATVNLSSATSSTNSPTSTSTSGVNSRATATVDDEGLSSVTSDSTDETTTSAETSTTTPSATTTDTTSAASNTETVAEQEWLALGVSDMAGFKTSEMDLTNLANAVSSSEFKGYEIVDGKLNGYYQINLGAQKFIEALGLTSLDTSKLASSLIQIDVWINKKDKLITKLKVTFNGEVENNRITSTTNLNYSSYGQSVKITKPAATSLLATDSLESWNTVTGNVAEEEPVDLTTAQGRDTARKNDLAKIKEAIDAYYAANFAYPISVTLDKTNSSGSVLAKALIPRYINSLPIDPLDPTHYYGYKSEDGKSYELSAVLEDSTDPLGEKVGSINLYKVKSSSVSSSTTTTTPTTSTSTSQTNN